MPTIVRGIRHNDIFQYPPPRASRSAPARRPTKDAARGVVQAIQRLGSKIDAITAKTADAEAKLERIAPAVAMVAEFREQRAVHDAMVAQNVRRAERLRAIRDGKPIRPETTEEMAAAHARHYGRAR